MESLQLQSFTFPLPIEAVIPTYTFQNISENMGVLNHFKGGILHVKKEIKRSIGFSFTFRTLQLVIIKMQH